MPEQSFLVGEIVETKKKHPCGSTRWKILRIGVDFKLECLGCGHKIMLDRTKALKAIKRVVNRDL